MTTVVEPIEIVFEKIGAENTFKINVDQSISNSIKGTTKNIGNILQMIYSNNKFNLNILIRFMFRTGLIYVYLNEVYKGKQKIENVLNFAWTFYLTTIFI